MSYTDIPEGFAPAEQQPTAPPSVYSDIPEGFAPAEQEAVPIPRFSDIPAGFEAVDDQAPQPQQATTPTVAASPAPTQAGDPTAPPTAEAAPERMGAVGEFFAAVQRGWYRPGMFAGGKLIGRQLGYGDDASLAADIAERERAYQASPQSQAQVGEGTFDWLDKEYIASQIGEQVGNVAEMSLAGLLGIPLGGVPTVGMMMGGSGLQEYSNAFNEYLKQKGVDLTDEAQIMTFLQNPELREEAFNYAALRGGVIGLFTGAAGGVGAKVLPALAGSGLGGKVATVPTTLAIGGAEEAGSEAVADIVTGEETSARELAESFALGSIFGVPEVVIPALAKGLKTGADRLVPPTAPASEDLDPRIVLDPVTGTPKLDAKYAERLDLNNPKVKEVVTLLERMKQVDDYLMGADVGGTDNEKLYLDQLEMEYKTENDTMPAWIRAELHVRPKTRKKSFDKQVLYEVIAKHYMRIRQDPNQGITTPMPKSMVPNILIDNPNGSETSLQVAEGTTKDQSLVLSVDKIDGDLTPDMIDRLSEELAEKGYAYLGLPKDMIGLEKQLREQGLQVEQMDVTDSFETQQFPRLVVKLPERHIPTVGEVGSEPTGKFAPGERRTKAVEPTIGLHDGRVQIGGPSYSAFSMRRTHTPQEREAVAGKILEIARKFTDLFKMKRGVEWILSDEEGLTLGSTRSYETGAHKIKIFFNNFADESGIFSTAIHELGHVLCIEHFYNATPATQLAILHEYAQFNEQVVAQRNKVDPRHQLGLPINRLTVDEFMGGNTLGWRGARPMGRNFADPQWLNYWGSFQEWFANSVAKWATSRDRPLTIVESFFSSLARKIRRALDRLHKWAGIKMEPGEALTDFLEAFVKDVHPSTFREEYARTLRTTMQESQRALDAIGAGENSAVPQTSEGRQAIENLLPHIPGPRHAQARQQVRAQAAFADKMNRFWRLMAGLPQVARMNPHLAELQLYKEDIARAQNEIAEMMNKAVETLRKAKKLPPPQIDALIDSLDDYVMMAYRTQDEQNRKVRRLPTPAELQQIWANHGLSPEGQQIFAQMVKDYDDMLTQVQHMLEEEAMKITDPVKQIMRMQEIATQIANMRKEPYVPLMRFGKYTVTVRDANGKRQDWMPFSIVESKAEQARLFREYEEQYGPLGLHVHAGEIPQIAQPLIGLPPNLLASMANKLNLSKQQMSVLNDLIYELSPAQSFKKRLMKRSRTPGYSKDFLRSYAQYFLHAANYITRVRYRDRLQGYIKALEDRAKVTRGLRQGRTRSSVVAYMAEHFKDWNDVKPDFWRVKAYAFHSLLGFNLKSAIANLTSIPIGTYPFLATHFGDIKALATIGKAMATRANFYTKGSLDQAAAAGWTDPVTRILGELYKEGTITEALATELAATAEGRNLIQRALGGHVAQGTQKFLQASASFFSMAEQINRRVTAAATAMLAIQNPNAKFVNDAVAQNQIQYNKLLQENWPPLYARALVAAKTSTEVTQGVYSRWGRAAFMRGKKGTIFMFKGFQQNYLWMLYNYPTTILRSTLILAFLGGVAGLPFYDDLRDLFKSVGKMAFGAQFDLEHWAREHLVAWTKDFAGEDGAQELSDSILFGASRDGFGIGTLFNMLGLPVPTVDLSSSMGIGPINPVPISPLLSGNVESAISEAAKGVAGIPFSLGFSGYEALRATQDSVAGSGLPVMDAVRFAMGDPNVINSWLKFIPRSVGQAGKAWWAGSEGGLLGRGGDKVIKFDVENTEHMAELIGMGLGFNPTRLSQAWDERLMKGEIIAFWETRRGVLMRQFYETLRRKDNDLKKQVIVAIKKFNRELPKSLKLKGIDAADLRRSVEERTENRVLKEKGLSGKRSDIPLAKKIDQLFPKAPQTIEQKIPTGR